MHLRTYILCAAVAVAAVVSCAGNADPGPAYYYMLTKEFDSGAVIDSSGMSYCDLLGTAACTDARNAATRTDPWERQLIPDGCTCAGRYVIEDAHLSISFSGGAKAGQGLTTADGGLFVYSKDDGGYCPATLVLSKAATLGNGAGAFYPDLAGAFTARCAGYDVRRGIFYLIRKEADPATGR